MYLIVSENQTVVIRIKNNRDIRDRSGKIRRRAARRSAGVTEKRGAYARARPDAGCHKPCQNRGTCVTATNRRFSVPGSHVRAARSRRARGPSSTTLRGAARRRRRRNP